MPLPRLCLNCEQKFQPISRLNKVCDKCRKQSREVVRSKLIKHYEIKKTQMKEER